MALRNKLDSNETELAYAEEVSIGVLGVTPVWYPLEPNEYDDFGGEFTLMARNPINSSRQRKKGSIVDLDAMGGFNQDFTLYNSQDIMQGVMFASFRRKAEGLVTSVDATGYQIANADDFAAGMLVFADGFTNAANNGLKLVTAAGTGEVSFTGSVVEGSPPAGASIVCVGVQLSAGDLDVSAPLGAYPSYTTTTLDFTDFGLIPGEWIFVGGDDEDFAFTNAANNGFKRIKSVAANALVIDRTVSDMVVEASTTETVRIFFGRVLKNELGANVVRRSYTLERKLGAPDTASPGSIQAEYVKGAVANEMTLNVETADKLNIDISFVAIDNEQRTSIEGLKSGTRATLTEADAFNTSSDFSTLRMFIHSTTDASPTPLFAYLQDLSITFNNNVSPNKAIAVLGAFDVTAGTFEVSGEATAYFTTVEAVRAVRNNSDVSIHMAVVKENAGFVLDLPLIALGDGRLNVEQDEPITIPLAMDAATAVKLDPNTDYTAMWVFFDYLPSLATP